MRRVRFRNPAGSIQTGEWNDEGIHFGGRTYDPESVDVLPPTEPSKIVCIGLNYVDHAHEVDMEIPDRPMMFLKPPNALAGHGDTITLPRGKERVDYEAELGVVIGEQCKNVAEADAMDVVGGYTCVNDISNRDDQEVEQNWVRGKAFDNSAPIGPVVVPPEDVADDARVRLRLNGEEKQNSSLSEFIFSVPELVAEVSRYLTLERGDVIITGTPPGVGPLTDGDTVEVDIEGIGTLRNEVRGE
ncbi:fumarylacetoacetate hydrolase family protein [Halogeometricum limi]|uniref:2-keto-4-pentenoate hydratase/2-oxohepta-3-ene-1,7-dioic acid hydratase (Catechol pathway) n=1 Tax=Halogeometricum limi TaxID=555875 RepID=A0A1I6IC36_9EURY|nr:fumarylacetoacetate hydrolase family protein [Halogeometricum limi]SFR64261.1 2-keto-4-pentenoate hydratase/2-oxohepta-3-ene-1,7-dioic acid hydratase (catechol pathway) [Halogeometricum limi]